MMMMIELLEKVRKKLNDRNYWIRPMAALGIFIGEL